MIQGRRIDTAGRLVLALVVVACGALTYRQTVRPLLASRHDLAELHAAIGMLSAAQGSVEQLNAQVEQIGHDIAVIEAQLPRDLDLDTFLEQLGNQADAAGVRIESLQPQVEVEHELLRERPLELQVSGSYPALYDFLDRLEHAGRLTQVQRLSITWDASRGLCAARMILGLYYARGEA